MPRALSIQRSIVPAAERAKFIERLKARRDHYTQRGCEFWVFEETALAGAFIEFAEAPDAATLTAAHVGIPGSVRDPARIYTAVELA